MNDVRDEATEILRRAAKEELDYFAPSFDRQKTRLLTPEWVAGLFAYIKHGDDEHRAWLKNAIAEYVEKTRGAQ